MRHPHRSTPWAASTWECGCVLGINAVAWKDWSNRILERTNGRQRAASETNKIHYLLTLDFFAICCSVFPRIRTCSYHCWCCCMATPLMRTFLEQRSSLLALSIQMLEWSQRSVLSVMSCLLTMPRFFLFTASSWWRDGLGPFQLSPFCWLDSRDPSFGR